MLQLEMENCTILSKILRQNTSKRFAKRLCASVAIKMKPLFLHKKQPHNNSIEAFKPLFMSCAMACVRQIQPPPQRRGAELRRRLLWMGARYYIEVKSRLEFSATSKLGQITHLSLKFLSCTQHLLIKIF